MKKQNLQSKFQYFEHGRKFIFPEQIIDAHICYIDIFIYNHVNMTVILLDFVGFVNIHFQLDIILTTHGVLSSSVDVARPPIDI